MKISTEQFMKLISEMTEAKPEMVLEQWETLLQQVRDLKPGETLELEQLGTFINEDGEINFTPSDKLADEINYEYSGQQPIVLEEGEEGSSAPIGKAGAEDDEFKKDEDAQPLFPDVDKVSEKPDDADDEDDIFGLNQEIAEEADPTPEVGETPSERVNEDEDSITDDKKREPVTSDEDDKLEPDSSEEEEKLETTEEPESEESIPPVEETPLFDEQELEQEAALAAAAAEEEAREKEAARMAEEIEREKEAKEAPRQVKGFNVWVAPHKRKSKPHPAQLVKLAVALIAIIFITVIAYVVISNMDTTNEPLTQAPVETPAEQEPPVVEEAEPIMPEEALDPAPPDQLDEEPEVEPEPEEVAETPAAEPAEPVYGLTGDLQPVPGRAFGIVVHSLSDRAVAENEAESLREQGYRVTVQRSQQAGQERWRVAIGQFPNINAATEAAQELPEPYRSSFFVTQLAQ